MSFGTGGFGIGSFGGDVSDLYLVREFSSVNTNPNEVSLNWKQPEYYDTSMEIVVVRRKDSFPMELYNDDPLFLSKVATSGFTDPAQVEIFRGGLIRKSSGTGSINQLEDLSASFPTSPSLVGRILRDSTSHNFRIISNTSTAITVNGTPSSGPYLILVDFPNSNDEEINGTTTSVGLSFLEDTSKDFIPKALVNRIVVDQAGTPFIVYDNTQTTITVVGTPTSGDYTILQEFADFTSPSDVNKGQFSYIDTFLNQSEADDRDGSGLEDDQFYYYTAFTHRTDQNVAQSVFATVDSLNSTQAAALSTKDRDFPTILLNFWPNVFKLVDTTGDFRDLMSIFGFGFNQIYSFVNTFNLTDADRIYYTTLNEIAQQTGVTIVDNKLGVDTNRRIISDILPTWEKKGSKLGIVDFIRIITTWDATNGTKDASSIIDDIPNSGALRFYSDALGSDNTRLFGFVPSYTNDPFVSYTYSSITGEVTYVSSVDLSSVEVDDVFVDGDGDVHDILDVDDGTDTITIDTGLSFTISTGGDIYKKTPLATAGRFFVTLPGVIIPGFFNFSEFIVEIENVALFVGESTNLSISTDSTVLTDSTANFGGTNNLVGNFLLPKQGQTNDIFEITANTSTTITVRGVARDSDIIGSYAVLSPLNAARFQRLITLMPTYAPSFARMGLQFT